MSQGSWTSLMHLLTLDGVVIEEEHTRSRPKLLEKYTKV